MFIKAVGDDKTKFCLNNNTESNWDVLFKAVQRIKTGRLLVFRLTLYFFH
jgi:hypothetical protein